MTSELNSSKPPNKQTNNSLFESEGSQKDTEHWMDNPVTQRSPFATAHMICASSGAMISGIVFRVKEK